MVWVCITKKIDKLLKSKLDRRVACRQDTCSITALSLNTTDQTHPIIWSLSGLPYDCIRVKAIPKPIGQNNFLV